MKKITGVLVCLMLVLTLVPLIGASKTDDNKVFPTGIEKFRDCYVELIGNITTADWARVFGINFVKIIHLGMHNRGFVLMWLMIFDPDATLNVYSEQGGELLYQHSGATYPEVVLFGFRGQWSANMPYFNVNGTAKGVNILERI